ncbi:MAG TPA: PEP/pyruvate-binding domain-containing protein [Candidatus Saccharimonadales bacterium]|nr:PEP/pyruvate-binding domain-containing protein [Candidatus Saccharimonadales bacterium]
MNQTNSVLWFADIDLESHDPHDKQTTHLAKLTQAKFPIPPGFIITKHVYQSFLRENNLAHKIRDLLSTVSFELPDSLMQAEHLIKHLFEETTFSKELEDQLKYFWKRLEATEAILSLHEKESHGRKHASAHVQNEKQFIKQIKDQWAQMFSGNALWHRHHKGLDHTDTSAEIIVQKKIHGDTMGVVITIDPTTHAKDKIIITTTHPHPGDRYILSKKNLTIIDRTISYQTNLPKLTHDELLAITKMAREIEEFLYFPQEISWTIDDNKLYIIEIKPVTTLPQEIKEPEKKVPHSRGKGVTPRIGTGITHIIHIQDDLKRVKSHDVVIITESNAKHMHHLKKVRGVVTEARFFPADLVVQLRHFGIPAIADIKDASKHFKNGHVITVHGGKGEIYKGGFH